MGRRGVLSSTGEEWMGHLTLKHKALHQEDSPRVDLFFRQTEDGAGGRASSSSTSPASTKSHGEPKQGLRLGIVLMDRDAQHAGTV